MRTKKKIAEDDFPDAEQLRLMRRLAAKAKFVSRGLSPNATGLERAKYTLCKQFIIYMRDHDLTQRELAKALQVAESRVSEIVHYHIDKITLDKLVELLERIDTKVSVRVA